MEKVQSSKQCNGPVTASIGGSCGQMVGEKINTNGIKIEPLFVNQNWNNLKFKLILVQSVGSGSIVK